MSISTECHAAGHLLQLDLSDQLRRCSVAAEHAICLRSTYQCASILSITLEHKIISSLSTQLSLRITATNEQWTYILSAPPIKRHLKRLVTISMTTNARRLNDELLNGSNGLLRSASSPGIASTMLMRFYPLITRCNEPLEAARAHIDGMSCCGPPPIGPLRSATKMYHPCWARYLSTNALFWNEYLLIVLMRFYSFNYIGAQKNL